VSILFPSFIKQLQSNKLLTRFGALEVKGSLLLVGGFAIISAAIEIVQVAIVVEGRGLVAVHVHPVGADLQLLVEGRRVGTEKTVVLHLLDKRISSSVKELRKTAKASKAPKTAPLDRQSNMQNLISYKWIR